MSDLVVKLKKNRVGRKAFALVNQLPRAVSRMSTRPEDFRSRPPVIANSFPKSGTHLLLQILEAFPDVRNYGTFISSVPAFTYKERSKRSHLGQIGRIVPGEVVAAHLFFDPAYLAALEKKNCAHFFIYRDLRDVAISEAHYLTYSYKVHRMHSHYARSLSSMEERIATAILGVTDPGFPVHYPSIAERFSRYREWIRQSNVFAVKYEDLLSERRNQVLLQMVEFFTERYGGGELNVSETVQRIEANIKPANSPTFRKARVGGWKEAFSEEHKSAAKKVVGELLVELGYEKDGDW